MLAISVLCDDLGRMCVIKTTHVDDITLHTESPDYLLSLLYITGRVISVEGIETIYDLYTNVK